MKIFRKYKKLIFVIALLAYMVGLFVLSREALQKSRVKKINVVVEDSLFNNYITADDVFQVLNDSGIVMLGKLCDSVNTYKIEKIISHLNMVKNVEVYVTFGGEVNIKIWQRNPIVRIINYDNENYYLDEEGYLLPYVEKKPGRVLVVTGKIDLPIKIFGEKFNVKYSEILFNRDTLLENIYNISEYIYNNSFWRNNIEQIYIQNEKEFHLIPKVGNFIIKFGDTKEYKKKFRNLLVFYRDVLPKVGWNSYKVIDLRYENQIVCKKR